MRRFVVTLIGTAAVSALIDSFVPDGGSELKKYLRYLIGLVILLVLLSPLRELAGLIPSALKDAEDALRDVSTAAQANAIVGMHIEKAVCDKFSLEPDEIDVTYDGTLHVRIKKHFGIFSEDIEAYILNSFGVMAEVVLCE